MSELVNKCCQRGFSLIEISIVLVIIGILAASAVQVYNVYYQSRIVQKTTENIEYVNDRIAGFVEEYGFYPCPAAPTDPSGVATDCATPLTTAVATPDPATGLSWDNGNPGQRVRIGTVPVSVRLASGDIVQLAPSERTVDGWKNRLTYAVVEQMAVPGTTVLNDPGSIILLDTSGATLETTGKHMILSHGQDGMGAYRQSGIVTRPCAAGSNDEQNCNGDRSFLSVGLSGTRSTTGDANNFDDFVMGDSVIATANCGPNEQVRGVNWRTREIICEPKDPMVCGTNIFVGLDPAGNPICSVPACPAGQIMVGLTVGGAPNCIAYDPNRIVTIDARLTTLESRVNTLESTLNSLLSSGLAVAPDWVSGWSAGCPAGTSLRTFHANVRNTNNSILHYCVR